MTKVMVFGTFDVIHLGHVYLFQNAKKFADKLIVVVATDKNVTKIKGHSALHSEMERQNLVSALKEVDEVRIGDETNPYLVIEQVQPDYIVLGYDQNNFVSNLEQKLEELKFNTKIIRLDSYRADTIKSSNIKRNTNWQII